MDLFLRNLGYDVTTAYDVGYTQKTDEEVIRYAKENSMILVTEDNKAAKLAELLEVKTIHLDMKMKAIAVSTKLRKKYD